jgi:signal peptidase I
MKIYFDFAFFLTMLVLLSGIIGLIDVLFFARKRREKNGKQPLIVEYARSFFPLLLVVWLIRSFLVQPYRVPTGSLVPTILPGDFIAVSQFSYGVRLPVLNYKIINVGEPKRGDIALFRWPENPGVIFVKRVIGVPGDHIYYHNKILKINGKIMSQNLIGKSVDIEPPNDLPVMVQDKLEDLDGIKHHIFIREDGGNAKSFEVIVPEGSYFMMGDNRDDSDDSRDWGFVPEENLIGKAFVVWFSWDSVNNNIRWKRIGTLLH